MTHYAPAQSIAPSLLDRLEAARRLAGVPPLDPFGPLDAALAAEPTERDVAEDLRRHRATLDDPAAWLDSAIGRMQRAQAADRVRRIAADKGTVIERHAAEWRAATLEAVAEKVADTIARLNAAAKKLPATGDPLDLAAVVAAHATRPMEQAIAALTELSTWAGIYGTTPMPELKGAQPLVLVVDVAKVAVEIRHPQRREQANPDETRAALRRMLNYAQSNGVDAAILAVARGDYGDAAWLALPADRAALGNREGRYRRIRQTEVRANLEPHELAAVKERQEPKPSFSVAPDDEVTFAGARPFR